MRAAALGSILVASLGSGCFSAPFSPAASCRAGSVELHLEKAASCAYYEDLVRRAFAEDTDRGFITQAEADAMRLTVWVHDDYPTARCDDGSYAAGCTAEWPGGAEVQLTKTGGALMHEILHVAEHARGVPDEQSAKHAGWDRQRRPERRGQLHG